MSSRSRSHRSSTSASSPPEATQATAQLQILLDNVSTTILKHLDNGYPSLSTTIEQLQSVRLHLIAASEPVAARNDFRRLLGFQLLLDTLRTFSGFYQPAKRTQKEKTQVFELLELVLNIVAQAFREHYGNRKYFKRRVEGGGWAALEQTIASIGVGDSESDIWSEAQLFGKLLSFALDDKRLESLCQAAAFRPSYVKEGKSDIVTDTGNDSITIGTNNKERGKEEKEMSNHDKEILNLLEKKLEGIIKEGSLLANPEIIPTIIDFWKTIPRDPKLSTNPASLVVILTLSKISSVSTHNLMALHSTGILSTLLSLAFDPQSPLATPERRAVEDLCGSLITLGVNTLDNARCLVCNESSTAQEFLLRAIKSSHSPPFIQFDLSLNGYASIELPTLGRPFPPSSSVAGYTFAAWIYVDQFDPNSHTTIFGAFDSTQTCFLLAYLEKDTHNFILQTSVTSSRPSVRFKSTVFQEQKWYHMAVVHRRPRTMTSSKASLYVNGEFVEVVKCQYPAYPPPVPAATEGFPSFASSGSKTNAVQAFIGTPQDLSARLGRGVVFSRWSLASAHLFEDVLSDDLVAVYYRLGPRYQGNFQDCLGSFQTYEASAALGMRNELMHPGKDEDSDILGAIRKKASNLLPESRILLSILPTAVLVDEDQTKIQESQLLRGLSRPAMNNLSTLAHNTGTSIAINTAIPSINHALIVAHGTTILTGDPVVVVPQSVDDALWQLGGFAGIALKLVEKADTRESITRAVKILFESIKESWRNSEAMEKDNGYAILGALLRGKIGAGTVVSLKGNNSSTVPTLSNEERDKLAFELLCLVLEFVGFNHEKPEESFIINPLAYRILLVDFDMWRKADIVTQRLYYNQFIVFGVNSKYHEFNSRRLFRMRIVKRFLDALKAEAFTQEHDSGGPSIFGANSAAPIVAWTDRAKKNLNVNVLGKSSVQSLPLSGLDEEILEVTLHAPQLVQSLPHFLVHSQSVASNRADVYHIDLTTGAIKKAYELPKLSGKGTVATNSQDANVYFIRFGGTEATLVSSISHGILGRWPVKLESVRGDFLHAASEVVARSTDTYAIRSALVTSNEDWVLVRNGLEAWNRPEGLSGSVAATWVEIPEEEDLAKTLQAEAHSNPLSAYIHRVKRHVNDLQYLPGYLETLPKRILSSILPTDSSLHDSNVLVRDSFGFNKLVIVATQRGRLYCLNAGNSGVVVWTRKAFDLPEAQKWDVRGIVADSLRGITTIRGYGGEEISVYSATGEVVKKTTSSSSSPIQSTAVVDGPEGKWLLSIPVDGEAGLDIPQNWSTGETLVIRGKDGEVKGLRFEALDGTTTVPITSWEFKPLAEEGIISVVSRPTHDPVASIGRVLGDRTVLYKYLNPNILLINTVNDKKNTASFFLVDTISGDILYHTTHDDVDVTQPIVSLLTENWFTYSLWINAATETAAKGYQLIIAEMFESDIPNYRGPLGNAANFSSLAPSDVPNAGPPLPYVVAQSFIIPEAITHMSVTQTQQGITSRQLICTLASNAIIGIPRNILDPRRPVGRDPTAAEMEEGLIRYEPVIEFDPRMIITHKREVIGIKDVITSPALLESTSLLLAYGIDIFGTRVAPSAAFDILGRSFNKSSLIATVAALGAGVAILAPMVRRKQINMRWIPA